MDEANRTSYLAIMATRLLLTLLALLTGLAAQLSPAQARMCADGASEMGALTTVARGERKTTARPCAPVPLAYSSGRQTRCTVVVMRADANCAPPVMLGIDRAHE